MKRKEATFRRIFKKRFHQNYEQMKSEEHINLLFLLDVTGSMNKYRDLLVDSIDLISSKLSHYAESDSSSKEKEENKKLFLKIKYASIAYRDKKDNVQFEIQQFTSNKQQFINNIKKLNCEGGLDVCEDIKGALQTMLKEIVWQSQYKYVVLIADSPCHGNNYHDSLLSDDYPDDDMMIELKEMASQEIIFIGITFTKSVEKMYNEIEAIYKTNHGKFHLIEEEDLKNIRNGSASSMNIVNLFAQRISEPVFQDFSDKTIKKYAQEKKISAIYLGCKNKTEKDFQKLFISETFLPMDCEVFVINYVNDLKPYYSNIYDLQVEAKKFNEWRCEISSDAATSGSFRRVYLLKVFKDKDEKNYIQYLAKCPKEKTCYDNIKDIIEEWRGSLFARHMSKLFRSETYEKCKKKPEFDVSFNDVFIIKSKNAEAYYAVEKVIEGPFTKYNNNLGWAAHFNRSNAENLKKSKWDFESFNKVAQAFSHYTFQKSQGYFLVCDLQGVIQNLTDPLVLTKKNTKNNANTSAMGILAFFQTHICNHICKELELEVMDKVLPEELTKIIEETKDKNYKNTEIHSVKLKEEKEGEGEGEDEDKDDNVLNMYDTFMRNLKESEKERFGIELEEKGKKKEPITRNSKKIKKINHPLKEI